MTASVATTTYLAPPRSERPTIFKRFMSAMIASRAKAAAREIERYRRKHGELGPLDENEFARQIVAEWQAKP